MGRPRTKPKQPSSAEPLDVLVLDDVRLRDPVRIPGSHQLFVVRFDSRDGYRIRLRAGVLLIQNDEGAVVVPWASALDAAVRETT